jgi:hypothetical protein
LDQLKLERSADNIKCQQKCRRTHVNVVAIELPNTPEDLEENDQPHLDEPRQKPSSRLDLNRIVHQVRRRNEDKEVNDVEGTPELHCIPDVGFEERRIELSGVSSEHAVHQLEKKPLDLSGES